MSLFDFSVDDHRIVAGDFRYFWLFINLSYILFYLFTFNNKLEPSIKYMYVYFYTYMLVLLRYSFMELNWQYERINMIIGILLIHVIGLFIKEWFLFVLNIKHVYIFISDYLSRNVLNWFNLKILCVVFLE